MTGTNRFVNKEDENKFIVKQGEEILKLNSRVVELEEENHRVRSERDSKAKELVKIKGQLDSLKAIIKSAVHMID